MRLSFFTEAEMPEERALSPVHCQEAPGATQRGQHKHVVPMSSRPHLPAAPHGTRSHRRQELYGGGHQDVQRLLRLLSRPQPSAQNCFKATPDTGQQQPSSETCREPQTESTNAKLRMVLLKPTITPMCSGYR
jgi:hypothetical protein